MRFRFGEYEGRYKSDKSPVGLCEDLNDDLVVLYGEDLDGRVRFVCPDDLKDAKVERAGLRALACDNLKRIRPKIKPQSDGNGVYILVSMGRMSRVCFCSTSFGPAAI